MLYDTSLSQVLKYGHPSHLEVGIQLQVKSYLERWPSNTRSENIYGSFCQCMYVCFCRTCMCVCVEL